MLDALNNAATYHPYLAISTSYESRKSLFVSYYMNIYHLTSFIFCNGK